jgi:chemotaxis protein CheD
MFDVMSTPDPAQATLSRFFDPHFERDVVKIKPGEFFATTRPCIIATVLGSCVSACIRDTARGGAGMNHFMLAQTLGEPGSPALDPPSLRYGAFAMESLINEFIKRGSRRQDLEAKVFGGATQLMAADLADLETSAVAGLSNLAGPPRAELF